VLTEGAAALEQAGARLKDLQAQAERLHEKAAGELQLYKAKAATLKASLAVGEVALPRAEAELKELGQGVERLAADLKALGHLRDQVVQEAQAKAKARAILEEELAGLTASRHPLSRTPGLRQAASRYLALARDFERTAAQLTGQLEKRLAELSQGQAELAAAREQLAASLDQAWWARLFTRSTYVAGLERLRAQVADTWQALLALPARVAELGRRLATSGALAAYLGAKAAPLTGLLLLLVGMTVAAVRLGRLVVPRLGDWQAAAEELSPRVILHLAHLVASQLALVALWVWLLLALMTLELGSHPAAYLTALAGGVLLARRLTRQLVNRVFAGPQAGGILPLDEATARFYRRHLRRLATYILLFGVLGLTTARVLGFSPGSRELLTYLFQVGLLGWALWILRPRYFETLVSELPVPAWFQRRGVLRLLRGLIFLCLSLIILTELLGFQALSLYLAQAAAGSGLAVVAAWVFWQGLRAALKHFFHPRHGRVSGRLPVRPEVAERSYRTLKHTLLAGVVAATLVMALSFWGMRPAHLARILEWLNYGPALGPIRLSPLALGAAILIVYGGFWFSRLLRAFLEMNLYPRRDWDPGVCYTISTTLHYVVLILTVLTALNVLGVPLANVALVAGALGVGIGFGLQNIVNNFLSGLILLFERPIKVGDLLVVDGQWGTVKEIRVRSTVFQTADKAVLIIPNSELLSSKIINWTHYGWGPTRLTLKVGVSYGSDVALVTRILLDLCAANPRVAPEPPPQVFFEAFGDSSLNFTIWVHVNTPGDRVPATHELNRAIFEAFRAHGIDIPFPQRDLHLKGWPPLPPSGAA
jgi:small-conductance mechanosensitive channel